MSRTSRGWVGGVVAFLLLVVGLGLLGGSVARAVRGGDAAGGGYDDPDYRTGRATAEVLDVDDSWSWDGEGIDVVYEVDGLTQVAWVEIRGRTPARGDRVEVAYDPEDPDDAVLVAPPAAASEGEAAPGTGSGAGALALAGFGAVLGSLIVVGLTVWWVRSAPRPAPTAWGAVPPDPQHPAPHPPDATAYPPQDGPWSNPR